jgi:tetratricopeptide (TPR) repeat protein
LAYLVGYTCHPTSTELKSAFQIFKANGNHYSAVARSQDFSTLSEKDADGSRVDDASLDVHPLPTQPNQQTYFETTFIQGGGTPAEFSVVVWSWDGDTLHEIFKKAFLRAGGVQIVGSTFAITDNHNDGSSTAEVYQLNDGRVLFSGLLNKTILAQAEASGRLIARNSEELNTLGSLWESLGEENRAIAAYNQSIQQDQSENNRFIYLALSELYEKTGQNVAAANTLERYKNLPGNALTPEMRLELEQKVQQLTKP